jgi:hypothetical protein
MANTTTLIKLSALDTVVMTANYSIEQGGIWIDGAKLGFIVGLSLNRIVTLGWFA